eukprot:scaffold8649_cov185-Amphora_coffeaeformis.AAC.17
MMKLRKGRTATRASADPVGGHLGNTSTPEFTTRKNRTTTFGLFDTFRKSNNSNKPVDEDETRLLKKGSYAMSERTEPTDALTAMSDTMSVASEEISTALNKTFAVFHTTSFTQSGQEIQFVDGFPLEEEDEGHFANVHKKALLNQESLNRLAVLETASQFSDPKNKQLRKDSLKIVEMRTEPPRIIDGDVAVTDFETISAIDAPSGSEVTFDPYKYLIEAESRYKDPAPMLGEDYREEVAEREEAETSLEEVEMGEEERVEAVQKKAEMKEKGLTNESVQEELASALSVGARTQSRNEEYISDASSYDEEEEVETVFKQDGTTSPLHSPGGSSSTASSDWGKESTQTREVSLFDAIFNKQKDDQDNDDGTGEDSDDDGSSLDFDAEEFATDDEGGGTVEGPSSPNSRGSSIILEEYEELDAIAALSGMFMNLVSCNIDGLAASIVVDYDDDYSLIEGENQPATGNTAVNTQLQPNTQTTGLKSVADRVPTPPVAPTSSFWSFLGAGCSS